LKRRRNLDTSVDSVYMKPITNNASEGSNLALDSLNSASEGSNSALEASDSASETSDLALIPEVNSL
ncbi:11315_t:CDS:2, partial [Dentiscutata heterogama]